MKSFLRNVRRLSENRNNLGVVELPERSPRTGKIEGDTLRLAITCREESKEFLPYKIKRELVWVAHQLLNDDTQIGIEGCKIVESPDKSGINETRQSQTK